MVYYLDGVIYNVGWCHSVLLQTSHRLTADDFTYVGCYCVSISQHLKDYTLAVTSHSVGSIRKKEEQVKINIKLPLL